ncbi:MAG: GDP-mannose 4,6-dehydratase [Planctomycetota bacterium]|nr:GDP-mannose 4,6-dehydratase [Planctomycetota bacterium]
MRYLITGGAGFIGSHLADRLLASSHDASVVLLDNLSTGSYANVEHLEGRASVRLLIGSVTDEALLEEAVREADAIFHLASAVGVKLVLDKPVQSIETIVKGTNAVLALARRYRRPVLIASTSEVYGKSKDLPFREDGDQVMGATDKQRWAYASAKALEEFLALAHFRESRLPVVIARLFNTVGPRQTGSYGMVLPNFCRQALTGQPITVYGDGKQRRCFCHVSDAVGALARLLAQPDARGQVVNVGADREISIGGLAERVKELTRSASAVQYIPYEQAYRDGFEDMERRVPCLEKAARLIGYAPRHSLDDCIRDTAAHQARLLGLTPPETRTEKPPMSAPSRKPPRGRRRK